MYEDENQWKWNKFVEIGSTMQNMRGVIRAERAQDALVLARVLRRTEFLVGSKERFETYETLLPKIASYLDGNTEVIQNAVEKYFLIRHCYARLDENLFQVSFSPKKSGIQSGFTCVVSNGSQKIRYFIKTHQHGPTEENPKSVQPPDSKELFIYKFLHNIGLGPEVHFIVPSHGSKMTIYIATKDCHLTLLSNLTGDTANTQALVQLDLISRILCLRDCTTNSSNCGQVDGKPMIVDFRIEKQSSGYIKSDILDKFYTGNGEFNYKGIMESAIAIPQEEKLSIIRESLQTWNLFFNIDKTVTEIDQLIRKLVSKIIVDDDLERYVLDVKENIKILSQVLNR